MWTLPLELTIDVGRAPAGLGLRAEASRAAVGGPPAAVGQAERQPAGNGKPSNGQSTSESELAKAFAALESAPVPRSTPAAPAESALEWLTGTPT